MKKKDFWRKSFLPMWLVGLFLVGNVSEGKDDEEEKMNVLYNKPMFEVRWKASNVMYFLMVNGFAIERQYTPDGQVSTSFPVNHLFRSGTNTIEIAVIPNKKNGPFSAEQKVEVELWVRPDEQEEPAYRIGTLSFQGAEEQEDMFKRSSPMEKLDSNNDFKRDENGDVQVGEITVDCSYIYPGALLFSREIIVPSSLPLWGFFDSDKFPNPKELIGTDELKKLKMDLYPEYERIQKALEDGSEAAIDAIMPMFEERNRETDLAFYKEPGETGRSIRAALLSDANSADKELVELIPDYVAVVREQNEVIGALTRARCESAIGFNYTEFKGSTDYDIFFRKQDGKWIICR